MPNPNPVAARLTQRRRRKPGDLTKLTRALWETIRDVEEALEAATTAEETYRGAHAMAACCNAYAKLLAVGEYEARLARLEQFMEVSAHAPFPTDPAGPRGVPDGARDDPTGPGQSPQWQ